MNNPNDRKKQVSPNVIKQRREFAALALAGVALASYGVSKTDEVVDAFSGHGQPDQQAVKDAKVHDQIVDATGDKLKKSDGIVLPTITLEDGTTAVATIPSELSAESIPTTTVASVPSIETGSDTGTTATSNTGGMPSPSEGINNNEPTAPPITSGGETPIGG